MVGGKQQQGGQRLGGSKLQMRQQQDDEEERFWQKRKGPGKNDKRGDDRQPMNRSPEAEFFSKCRNRMPKPLYLELLKCLNLYSQQVTRSSHLPAPHDLHHMTCTT